MDDSRLVVRLLSQALGLAAGARVKTVHIRAGALSNISPAVLLRQFTRVSMGTTLEGVGLEFDVGHDPLAPDALRVFVTHVELAY
jgi:Zn finger protein HypA/HybF involved in hydrogenase expression